jgi:hypothetical protein
LEDRLKSPHIPLLPQTSPCRGMMRAGLSLTNGTVRALRVAEGTVPVTCSDAVSEGDVVGPGLNLILIPSKMNWMHASQG